jgi:hypothetical protein
MVLYKKPSSVANVCLRMASARKGYVVLPSRKDIFYLLTWLTFLTTYDFSSFQLPKVGG